MNNMPRFGKYPIVASRDKNIIINQPICDQTIIIILTSTIFSYTFSVISIIFTLVKFLYYNILILCKSLIIRTLCSYKPYLQCDDIFPSLIDKYLIAMFSKTSKLSNNKVACLRYTVLNLTTNA